jgi:hypothetical protein
MRDSTIFYRSFYEAVRELSLEQQGAIYNAIFEYSLNDSEPTLTGICKTVFTLIKPQLDANNKRYQNGKRGGKREPNPNQNVTKPEPKVNQNRTKTEPNVNDNVNENENKNENNINAPAREDFLLFCKGLDIDFDKLQDTIGAKYDTWIRAGWRNGFGKPITDWQQTIINTIPHLKPMPKKKQAPADVKTTLNFGKR